MCTVQTGDGHSKRRHIHQIRKRHATTVSDRPAFEWTKGLTNLQGPGHSLEASPVDPVITTPVSEKVASSEGVPGHLSTDTPPDGRAGALSVLRRPMTAKQAPAHLKDYVW